MIQKIINILLVLFLSLLLTACGKKDIQDKNDIIYPDSNDYNYSSLENFNAYTTIDGLKYDYIFYFDNDECVNAEVKIVFDSSNSANEFYNNIKDNDMYEDITINENTIKYFHNIENFIYAMYPESALKELLQKNDFVIEE